MDSFLATELGPWEMSQILKAFGFIVAAFLFRMIAVTVVGRRLKALAGRTETQADDVAYHAVIGPIGSLILVAGVYFAFRVLASETGTLLENSSKVFKVLLTVIIAWGVFRLVDAVAIVMVELSRKTDNKLDDMVVPLFRKAAKVLVSIMAFLLSVQNLGYSVSGLLAGLGLGGLAFALAAKDTIANLFGGVTILIDRPFKVGDWVTMGDTDGVVEEIGLRSSRIRTFAKTLVSVPNQTLANATVENHSLMPKRRVKMSVGVTYDATPEQMRTLVARVEGFLKEHPGVHQEFMLVKFTAFGESSLDLFVYYFSATTDWTEHLQVRQEVNLGIMDIVAELGLSIAFPTRTIHMMNEED